MRPATVQQIDAAIAHLGLVNEFGSVLRATQLGADRVALADGAITLVGKTRRELARKAHPDLGGSVEAMAAINAAADLVVAFMAQWKTAEPQGVVLAPIHTQYHRGATTTIHVIWRGL